MSSPMPVDISRARTVLMEVPRHGKVAYCLLRDPRVPMWPKLALLAALALVVSPLDFAKPSRIAIACRVGRSNSSHPRP